MIVDLVKINGCHNSNSSLGIQVRLILSPVVEGRKVLKSYRIKMNSEKLCSFLNTHYYNIHLIFSSFSSTKGKDTWNVKIMSMFLFR